MTAHRHHLVLVDRGAQHRLRWIPRCGCGGVDARESLTREDWPALGAFRKNTKAFPGTSEVS